MKKNIVLLLFSIHFFLMAPFGAFLPSFCSAQQTSLFSFADSNGIFPHGSLLLRGGLLYGMTSYGGLYNNGCIFSIDTSLSNFTDLHDFYDTLGQTPLGSLTAAPSGTGLHPRYMLYGMTDSGGKYNKGCIFVIDTDGSNYRILHHFNDTAGANPSGNITVSGGILYGLTSQGGRQHEGTIFSLDSNGSNFTMLHYFNDTTGAYPYGSLLLLDSILYGTASTGGSFDSGCLFSMNITRSADSGYKNLFDFNGPYGANPQGSITLAEAGTGRLAEKKLTLMTCAGGAYHLGCIFTIDTDGSRYNVLFNFSGGIISGSENTGSFPFGSLTLNNNLLYGMTSRGGMNNYGTIFSIDTGGSQLKELFYFNSYSGAYPLGDLTLSGKNLFGMADYGGTYNVGVIFGIDTNAVVQTSVINLAENIPSIQLYPNPNNGVFTILSDYQAESVEIYNTLGRQVYSAKTSLSEKLTNVSRLISIDLSSQPGGIYFYRLLSGNSQLVGDGKFIIQK